MNEQMSKIFNNTIFVPASVGVVSFGLGVGVGYILSRRIKHQQHSNPSQLKFDYKGVEEFLAAHEEEPVEEPAKETDTELLEPDKEGVVTLGKQFVDHLVSETEESTDEPVARTIFAGTTDEWNYEEEIKLRSSTQPYVIHRDEFYGDEVEYTQSTLTYYAGDDILVDENDSPIYNHDTVVGPLRFGHGSEDPNVFHVRNDLRKAEYEIIHDQGLYSKEVLGLDIEDNQRVKDLKHSDGPRKFKMD